MFEKKVMLRCKKFQSLKSLAHLWETHFKV